MQVPGLLLIVYMAVYSWWPAFLRFWVPLVTLLAALGAIAIEVRLAIVYGEDAVDEVRGWVTGDAVGSAFAGSTGG